ncbi:hypothetical protein BXZ70DRAFT_1006169 [Cristinia sonorae]|uniref:Uncharacterized protein n=1 Tax=Cristinia sonorae TaxID=1940300 RepID=A0A8K0USN5_9AGAR|nr:hypothetical protein BXZ70DRAFT_1006169 [Cristinia sonorae]
MTTTQWDKNLTASLSVAINLAYSHIYNERRMELPLYGAYGLFSSLLCPATQSQINSQTKVTETTLAFPQWPLYRRSNEDVLKPDDASIRTSPDKYAKGVLVDFALLCVETKLKPEFKNPYNALNMISKSSTSRTRKIDYGKFLFETPPYVTTRVINVTVPLLLEVKRSPSRNPKSVGVWALQLEKLLQAAQAQVMQQATCLFSSVKYWKQSRVLIVAAAGEWWSWAIVGRRWFSSDTVFNFPTFVAEVERANDIVKTVAESVQDDIERHGDDAVEEEDDEDLDEPRDWGPQLERIADGEYCSIGQMTDLVEQEVPKLESAREARYRAREDRGKVKPEISSQATKEVNIIDIDRIEQEYHKTDAWAGPGRLTEPSDDLTSSRQEERLKKLQGKDASSPWSYALRVGTKASEWHMALLRKWIANPENFKGSIPAVTGSIPTVSIISFLS